ncbi:MAG TPA: response regulator [Candidatus Binataceae bacterium]|nr:response regulator [Candidatus Binataceae bacterium]
MPEKESIAIVDDDESIRRALTRMLTTAGFGVAAYSSASELLAVPESERACCVISDLRMPDIDGLQLQRQLAEHVPHVAVIFLTGHADVSAGVRAMKLGAIDFLEKPVKRVDLLEAIRRATQRAHRAAAESAELSKLRQRYEQLTPREREVFALVTTGLLNKQIAAELGAAEKTIKQHRGVVMHKMCAHSLADLVLMAHHLGVRPSQLDLTDAKGPIRVS